MLEGVRFIKEYIQHSRHRAVVINRQDEQGVCCKLPANCRFNPPIGLDILDTQNLAARRIMPRDRQCGHHMLPYISRATTASSPVNQLISLQKTDSDSSGVGNVSRTHSDQIDSSIDVEFVRRNCPLEFDNGRERLSIQATVLHCKCLGQKHLEGLGIEVVGSQSRRAPICGCTAGWWAPAGERSEPALVPLAAVSHRSNLPSIAMRQN